MRAPLAIVALTLVLAGCNTIAGVGEDITGAAEYVQYNLMGSGY